MKKPNIDIPPRPKDFKDEDGEINWEAFYDAVEDYELQRDGLR